MSARAAVLAGALLAGGCLEGRHDLGPPTPAQLLKTRPYALVTPPGYSASRPAPLIIALHGYGSSAVELEQWWQLAAATNAHGAFYAPLDAQADRNRNQSWNAVPNSQLPPYDVEYIGAVIDDVSAKYAIDPRRVFVTGVSQGGFMAYRMACDLPEKIAAIVSLSGQSPSDNSLCHPAVPVSIVEVHGDRDADILYDGSNGPSAHDTVGAWADRDRCTGAIALTGQKLDVDADLPGAETKVEAYGGCPAGIGVELWTVVGGAHHPNLMTPQWAELVVGWLQQHPKP